MRWIYGRNIDVHEEEKIEKVKEELSQGQEWMNVVHL